MRILHVIRTRKKKMVSFWLCKGCILGFISVMSKLVDGHDHKYDIRKQNLRYYKITRTKIHKIPKTFFRTENVL